MKIIPWIFVPPDEGGGMEINMTDMRRKILQNILVACLAAAAGILVYPSFMDALNDTGQIAVIGGYEEAVAELGAGEIAEMKERAQAYNQKIYLAQQSAEFMYQGEEYEDEEYDGILTPPGGSLVMGYVEIPKIGVYLPVTHGTKTEELKYRAGHLRGTSVPVGGEPSHAVIAAHTGLQNADLFTDVSELDPGDVFYIHVLDEIHAYTVDQVKIVLPGDEVPYIQVIEGEDKITLFTCTPYGINDHRLLVRGTRTYPDPSYGLKDAGTADYSSKSIRAVILTIIFAIIPLIVLTTGLYMTNRSRCKGESACDEDYAFTKRRL